MSDTRVLDIMRLGLLFKRISQNFNMQSWFLISKESAH